MCVCVCVCVHVYNRSICYMKTYLKKMCEVK